MYLLPRVCLCMCACVRACLCEHVVNAERKNNVNVTVNTLCKSVALSADRQQRLRRRRQRRQLHRRQKLFFVNAFSAFLPFIVSRAREKQRTKGNKIKMRNLLLGICPSESQYLGSLKRCPQFLPRSQTGAHCVCT